MESLAGGALPRSTFEGALDKTEALLGEHAAGPFFCGAAPSAADVAWAPFLERWAAQLPCLHEGLTVRGGDAGRWPLLSAWFDAMEREVPAYGCRVQGDAASWRKVLSMAGYGNGGVPPKVLARMDEAREDLHRMMMEHELWDAPLLVLANKQDDPQAASPREITEHLQLFSLTNRNWYIIDTRATHPDASEANLYAGLDWLVEVLLMPAAKRQEKAKQDYKARRAAVQGA